MFGSVAFIILIVASVVTSNPKPVKLIDLINNAKEDYQNCYNQIYKDHPLDYTNVDDTNKELHQTMHLLCPPNNYVTPCIDKLEEKFKNPIYEESIDDGDRLKAIQEYIQHQKIVHQTFCTANRKNVEDFVRSGGLDCGKINFEVIKGRCIGNKKLLETAQEVNLCSALSATMHCLVDEYKNLCTDETQIRTMLELYLIFKSQLTDSLHCENEIKHK